MKRLLVALAILLIAASSASARPVRASHGISFSGYDWHLHSGTNGAGQCQSPDHVNIVGGNLVATVSGGCGGGIGMALNKHLGTWSVTYRMSAGAGKYAILLWPENGQRPEVDFAEDKPDDANRTLVTGTYHPLPGCNNCTHVQTSGDFTQWHTASVRWTSSGYALLMDGQQWAFFPSSYGGNMHLSIAAAPWGDQGTSQLEVSNVTVS